MLHLLNQPQFLFCFGCWHIAVVKFHRKAYSKCVKLWKVCCAVPGHTLLHLYPSKHSLCMMVVQLPKEMYTAKPKLLKFKKMQSAFLIFSFSFFFWQWEKSNFQGKTKVFQPWSEHVLSQTCGRLVTSLLQWISFVRSDWTKATIWYWCYPNKFCCSFSLNWELFLVFL